MAERQYQIDAETYVNVNESVDDQYQISLDSYIYIYSSEAVETTKSPPLFRRSTRFFKGR